MWEVVAHCSLKTRVVGITVFVPMVHACRVSRAEYAARKRFVVLPLSTREFRTRSLRQLLRVERVVAVDAAYSMECSAT
jgi:hypothetical protein